MQDGSGQDAKALLDGIVGRRSAAEGEVTADGVEELLATFDHPPRRPAAGEPIPPAWHWLYLRTVAPQHELGQDGHPRTGSFLPALPSLPRRMWGGSRLHFLRPIRVGDRLTAASEITACTMRQGRSGRFAVVTVRHEVSAGGALATIDEHDIVYREPAAPGAGAPPRADGADPDATAAEAADFERIVQPDPVMLFRFSAVTFNGHRIHYDHPYVTDVEGYPGLVVHGPMMALLMLDLLHRRRPGIDIERFEFRALSPVFVPQRIAVKAAATADGGGFATWIESPGGVAMRGVATCRSAGGAKTAAPAG
jgi:3-methylfumaryl-CoA hydratase